MSTPAPDASVPADASVRADASVPADASAAAGGGRARRVGSRAVATLAVLLGAGLVVVVAGRPWARTTIAGLPGPDLITVDGRSLAPGAPALALVAAAGAVVLATSGRVLRRIVAVLLVGAGAGIVAVSLSALADPTGALETVVSKATGTTGAAGGYTGRGTPWPVVSAVGGVLVVVGGVLAVLRSGRWTGPSQRFERGATGRGEVSAVADGTKVTTVVPGSAVQPVRSAKDERLDAWDRLSAGEDPTD